MLAGEGDLFQAVLYLLAIGNMGGGDCGHTHNGVHRRTDVVAHIGKELALGFGSRFCFLPGLIQLLHLLAGDPEIFNKNQKQRNQYNAAAAQHHPDPAAA